MRALMSSCANQQKRGDYPTVRCAYMSSSSLLSSSSLSSSSEFVQFSKLLIDECRELVQAVADVDREVADFGPRQDEGLVLMQAFRLHDHQAVTAFDVPRLRVDAALDFVVSSLDLESLRQLGHDESGRVTEPLSLTTVE